MPCLDEEQVLKFLAQEMTTEERAAAEAHVDGCPACRLLLGYAAKDQRASRSTAAVSAPAPAATAAAAPTGYTRVLGDGAGARAPLLAPGDRVDTFTIEGPIGAGGMGTIFLARDTQLKRPVALKLISAAFFDSAEAKERLLAEARATARLNHPHVVSIYSVGEYRGQPYLALEYLEGETLRQRLDREPPVTLEAALRIGLAIAEALSEAHAHAVLHRDLKPQNVFLPNDGRLRVLDFGLAKLVRARALSGQTSIDELTTGEGIIVGTPSHMAPEQWRGEAATETTDSWALGLILFELIAGRRPYAERSTISYAIKVCEPERVPSVEEVSDVAGVPPAVTRLISRCLEKDPTARPEVSAVAATLRELLAEDAGTLVAQLTAAAAAWEEQGRVDAALWTGLRLARAQGAVEQGHAPLPVAAARFLAASIRRSQAEERRQRTRLRRAAMAVGGLAVIAALLAAGAFAAERSARLQRQRAEQERAAALVEGARAALANHDPLVARAKLRSALEVTDSVPGRFLWWELAQEALVWSRDLGTGLFDVAVSPDGSRIAAAAQDRTVYLVDAEGLTVRSLRGHGDQVLRVAFSPDGRRLASSSWSSEVRVWELESGRVQVLADRGARITALGFGGDGARLFGAEKGGALLSWRLDGGGVPLVVAEAVDAVALGVTADGATAVTLDAVGRVSMWDTTGGAERPLRTLPETAGAIRAVALDHASTTLATSFADGSIGLWALASGELTARLRSVETTGRHLRFSADDRFLVVAGQRALTTWEVATGRAVTLGAHAGDVTGLASMPGGAAVVSVGLDRRLSLWHLTPPAASPTPLGAHRDGVAAVAVSADGGWVLSGSYDREIGIWDAASGARLHAVAGHTDTVYGLAEAPGGELWASASWDRTVRLWRLPLGHAEQVLEGHSGGIYAVAFSPDGTRLASASTDGTVRTWRVDGGRAEQVLRGHDGPVFAVAWSPDGRRLASAGADRTIRLWNAASGDAVAVRRGHQGSVWSVAFSPDGRALASGSYDRTVVLWPVDGEHGRTLGSHSGRVYSVAFAPDGAAVFAGGADGEVVRWEVATSARRSIGRHLGEVNRIAVSADGRRVVSGGDDATVRIWDASGRGPLWRAPLLTDAPRRLATPAGWRALDRGSAPAPEPAATAWERRLFEAGSSAALDRTGRALCLATIDGRLEGWSLERDAARFSAPLPEGDVAERVIPVGDGCAVLVGGTVRLYRGSGAYQELRRHVSALTWVPETTEILVAAEDQLVSFDPAGQRGAIVAIDPGATALARLNGATLIGYGNGKLESLAADGSRRPGPALSTAPSSPVTLIAAGPRETLIVGFANGLVGMWSVANGELLLKRHLHGPVRQAVGGEGSITAVSELGGVLGPLELFGTGHCDLLRRVWKAVPVIWHRGMPVAAPPPTDHPCWDETVR